jgi:type IV pilus assembly protein PilW
MSLIELMISVAIGLLLLAGISSLIVNQSKTRADLDKVTRQIENGRYAIQVLQDDVQLAGYYGEFVNTGINAIVTPSGADPCAPFTSGSTITADVLTALPMHVQGYDSGSLTYTPLLCLADANYLHGTDILVVRRADTTVTTVTAAAANVSQVYLQTTLSDKKMDNGGSSVFTLKKKDGITAADMRKWLVHIYFVSPCNVATGAAASGNPNTCTSTDDNGKPIPTLKMLELNSSGTFTMTSLAEGVQNLQIEYGIDDDGDGAPDRFTTGPASTPGTDWVNVMALKVYVLARNSEEMVGYRDTKSYNLGLTTIAAAGDKYQRHVFSTLIRLSNPAGRKEL